MPFWNVKKFNIFFLKKKDILIKQLSNVTIANNFAMYAQIIRIYYLLLIFLIIAFFFKEIALNVLLDTNIIKIINNAYQNVKNKSFI